MDAPSRLLTNDQCRPTPAVADKDPAVQPSSCIWDASDASLSQKWEQAAEIKAAVRNHLSGCCPVLPGLYSLVELWAATQGIAINSHEASDIPPLLLLVVAFLQQTAQQVGGGVPPASHGPPLLPPIRWLVQGGSSLDPTLPPPQEPVEGAVSGFARGARGFLPSLVLQEDMPAMQQCMHSQAAWWKEQQQQQRLPSSTPCSDLLLGFFEFWSEHLQAWLSTCAGSALANTWVGTWEVAEPQGQHAVFGVSDAFAPPGTRTAPGWAVDRIQAASVAAAFQSAVRAIQAGLQQAGAAAAAAAAGAAAGSSPGPPAARAELGQGDFDSRTLGVCLVQVLGAGLSGPGAGLSSPLEGHQLTEPSCSSSSHFSAALRSSLSSSFGNTGCSSFNARSSASGSSGSSFSSCCSMGPRDMGGCSLPSWRGPASFTAPGPAASTRPPPPPCALPPGTIPAQPTLPGYSAEVVQPGSSLTGQEQQERVVAAAARQQQQQACSVVLTPVVCCGVDRQGGARPDAADLEKKEDQGGEGGSREAADIKRWQVREQRRRQERQRKERQQQLEQKQHRIRQRQLRQRLLQEQEQQQQQEEQHQQQHQEQQQQQQQQQEQQQEQEHQRQEQEQQQQQQEGPRAEELDVLQLLLEHCLSCLGLGPPLYLPRAFPLAVGLAGNDLCCMDLILRGGRVGSFDTLPSLEVEMVLFSGQAREVRGARSAAAAAALSWLQAHQGLALRLSLLQLDGLCAAALGHHHQAQAQAQAQQQVPWEVRKRELRSQLQDLSAQQEVAGEEDSAEGLWGPQGLLKHCLANLGLPPPQFLSALQRSPPGLLLAEGESCQISLVLKGGRLPRCNVLPGLELEMMLFAGQGSSTWQARAHASAAALTWMAGHQGLLLRLGVLQLERPIAAAVALFEADQRQQEQEQWQLWQQQWQVDGWSQQQLQQQQEIGLDQVLVLSQQHQLVGLQQPQQQSGLDLDLELMPPGLELPPPEQQAGLFGLADQISLQHQLEQGLVAQLEQGSHTPSQSPRGSSRGEGRGRATDPTDILSHLLALLELPKVKWTGLQGGSGSTKYQSVLKLEALSLSHTRRCDGSWLAPVDIEGLEFRGRSGSSKKHARSVAAVAAVSQLLALDPLSQRLAEAGALAPIQQHLDHWLHLYGDFPRRLQQQAQQKKKAMQVPQRHTGAAKLLADCCEMLGLAEPEGVEFEVKRVGMWGHRIKLGDHLLADQPREPPPQALLAALSTTHCVDILGYGSSRGAAKDNAGRAALRWMLAVDEQVAERVRIFKGRLEHARLLAQPTQGEAGCSTAR